MPQLPNSPDVQAKGVSPESLILPDSVGMEVENRAVNAPNFVEKKVDILPEITPPSDFVTKKLNQFGEDITNGRQVDVEFESWLSQQEKQIEPKFRQAQVESSKAKFGKIMDDFSKEASSTMEATVSAPNKALKAAAFGVVDFADEAMNSAISLANVSRRFFGVKELDKLPDMGASLPEPTTSGEKFVRSATKLMTGMLPISKGLKATAGITGITNSAASAGLYGFIFDDNKTDGLVGEFLKDNFEIAPDVIKYLNHESDDNEFVTRLKNSANYVVDDLAFEGVFYSLKTAKNLIKGRDQAYKVLENGDVSVKATKKTEKSLFEEAVSVKAPKVVGLTTEDIGKKSTKDILEEKLVSARDEVITKYVAKQEGVPERMVQGRTEALAAIKKNPMSLKQLLDIPENAPINNQIVMQAEIASSALNATAIDIFDQALAGKVDKEIALYKIINISEAMNKLTFPRSTSGRALESAKFISSLDSADKIPMNTIKQMQDMFGNDAGMILDEVRLSKENLSGFPAADAAITALRKNVDLEKTWKYVSTARINWILSDPTIHTANVASNAITTGLRTATDLTAAGVSKTRSILGNKYLAKGVAFNESRAGIQGYISGMGKAFKIIADNLETLKSEKSLNSPKYKSLYERDSNTKYNKAIDKIIEESDTANNFEHSTTGKQAIKTIGHLIAGTPVGKMLSWEDDFFKGMHYMAEVNKQLVMKENTIARAASQIQDPELAKNYTSSKLAEVNATRENFKKGIIDEEIDKAAKDSANYWTFNAELAGQDVVTKSLQALGDFRSKMFPMKWFVPFYNTGANIANMSIEYTPVLGGIAKMGNVGGVAGLMRGGREADQFIAKQAVGAMVMTTAAVAYSFLEDTFGVDFHISSLKNNKVGLKIGPFETTLDKQNPVFKIFVATKDIMDIANIADQSEGAKAAANASAALLMEMYSPEQLITVLGAMSDLSNGTQKDIPAKLENLFKMNIMSQITPYSGAARFAQRDVVGMNKVVMGQEHGEDLLDEMIKRIKHTYLGDSADIPARRGIFGQEIPYLRTLGYAVSDNAHDMMAGFSSTDSVVQEIFKLTREEVMSNPQNFDSFELNNTTILNMPERSIVLPTGEAYELTPSEYSAYVDYSAGNHSMFKGKTLHDTLGKFISSDKYQKLPVKYQTVAIKDIVNLYRKAAKGILLNDKPEIMLEAKTSLDRLQQEYMNVK